MKIRYMKIMISLLLLAVITSGMTFVYGETSKRYYGDLNNNGTVDINDARTVLRISIGLEDPAEGDDFTCIDMNRDNVINVDDARLILRTAIGLESSLYMTINSPGDTASLIDKINELRSSSNLSSLDSSIELDSSACVLSEEYSRTGNAELRPDSSYWYTALTDISLSPSYADAVFYKGSSDFNEVFSALCSDTKAGRNIVYSSYKQIGAACYEAADGTCYWCVIFAY